MRFLTLSTIIALLSVFSVTSYAQVQTDAETAVDKIGYLHITEPFANVYEKLDPMSPLVRQAKKGEFLELVYDGEVWHKVKIDGKIGWVEKKAGKITKTAGGVPTGTIVFLFLIIGATVALIYFRRSGGAQAAGVDNDL